jgi:hypothetical protein
MDKQIEYARLNWHRHTAKRQVSRLLVKDIRPKRMTHQRHI